MSGNNSLPLSSVPLKDGHLAAPNDQMSMLSLGGSVYKTAPRGESGYTTTVFEGKHDQMIKVCAHIKEKGFIPVELINNEVAWFYG
jgi:hypothetical protein